MKTVKIVSFIVPVYNGECCLKKCLDSFCLEQILNLIEVLIVNDGSTDRTAAIGKIYAEKYPDTFRLFSKENGGHGSAINYGVIRAQGKYIKVIDADDWVMTQNLLIYTEALSVASADVVVTPFYTIDIKTGHRENMAINPTAYCVSTSLGKVLETWNETKNGFTFHGITYRTDFYRRYDHQLLEKIYYEDHEYATIPCCFAEKIMLLDTYLYVYQIGNESQSISVHNQLLRLSHLKIVINEMILYSLGHREMLGTEGWKFFLEKLNMVILGYYKIVCLDEPDKIEGRQNARTLCKKVKKEIPTLYTKTKLKYFLFLIMSYLHITPEFFTLLLNSGFYIKIKRLFTTKK